MMSFLLWQLGTLLAWELAFQACCASPFAIAQKVLRGVICSAPVNGIAIFERGSSDFGSTRIAP
jgi:hypothetical protein